MIKWRLNVFRVHSYDHMFNLFPELMDKLLLTKTYTAKMENSHTLVNSRWFYQSHSKYSMLERLQMRQLSVAVILVLRPPTCIIPSLKQTCNLQGSACREELPCPSSGYTSVDWHESTLIPISFSSQMKKPAVYLPYICCIRQIIHEMLSVFRNYAIHATKMHCDKAKFCVSALCRIFVHFYAVCIDAKLAWYVRYTKLSFVKRYPVLVKTKWMGKEHFVAEQHLLLSHSCLKVPYACL